MLQFNFDPFPVLETERLILRKIGNNDVNEIFRLRSDANVMRYVPRPLVKNKEEALEHIAKISDLIEKKEGINWAITLKESPVFIGIIGYHRIKPEHFRSEIGYMLLPEFNGQGIITEAIHAAVDYGFEVMELHSIEAIIDPGNLGSERVLQKNGFVKEAHMIENEYFDGKFLDTVIYSLLKRNFKRQLNHQ